MYKIVAALIIIFYACMAHYNSDQTTFERKVDSITSHKNNSKHIVELDGIDYSSFCYVKTKDAIIKISYYNTWMLMDSISQRRRNPKSYESYFRDIITKCINYHKDSLDISGINNTLHTWIVSDLLTIGKAKVYDIQNNVYVKDIIADTYSDEGDEDNCPTKGKAYFFIDGRFILKAAEIIY